MAVVGRRTSVLVLLNKVFASRSYPLYNHRRWFGQPVAHTHPHLIEQGHVTRGISAEEYRTRRVSLVEKVIEKGESFGSSGRNVVIVPSAPKVYMTQDIPYVFRQNTDFLYLCGFLEPDSILLLDADGSSQFDHRSILFVPKRDVTKELWDGPRSGTEGALELTGVDETYNVEEFDDFCTRYLKDRSRELFIWYDFKKPAHLEFHAKYFHKIIKDSLRMETVDSPRSIIQMLRLVKSPAEIELMRESCSIASNSFAEVMKFSKPGINEAHLSAKMEFESKMLGANYLAYPPVVAGGNRANTIHYISNNQLIDDGQMVLMDAGCEYHGYTSDITRTWPINGRFSRRQHDLYEALLEVQLKCIQLYEPGGLTMDQLYVEMLHMIGKQLERLSLISSNLTKSQQLMLTRRFCPHHVSHYLGMDVHDTDEIPRNLRLQPGVVITVEPGIYIADNHTEVAKEWRGNGLRIEDDILITQNGPENLSRNCPKEIGEIEKLMQCT